jgi:hypothetical protein
MTMSSYYSWPKSFGVNVSPPQTPLQKVPPEQTASSHSPLKSDMFFAGNQKIQMGVDPNSLKKMCPVDKRKLLGNKGLKFLEKAIIYKRTKNWGAREVDKIVDAVIANHYQDFTPEEKAEARDIYDYAAKNPCSYPITFVPSDASRKRRKPGQKPGSKSNNDKGKTRKKETARFSPQSSIKEIAPSEPKRKSSIEKVVQSPMRDPMPSPQGRNQPENQIPNIEQCLLEIQRLIVETLSNEALKQSSKAVQNEAVQTIKTRVRKVEKAFPIVKDWDEQYDNLNQSWKTWKETNRLDPGIKTVEGHLQVIKFVLEHLQFSTELEPGVQLSGEQAEKLSIKQAKIIESVQNYIQAVQDAPGVLLDRKQAKSIKSIQDYIQAFQEAWPPQTQHEFSRRIQV